MADQLHFSESVLMPVFHIGVSRCRHSHDTGCQTLKVVHWSSITFRGKPHPLSIFNIPTIFDATQRLMPPDEEFD